LTGASLIFSSEIVTLTVFDIVEVGWLADPLRIPPAIPD